MVTQGAGKSTCSEERRNQNQETLCSRQAPPVPRGGQKGNDTAQKCGKGFNMIFNNDEMNLMCIYDTGSRTGLMNALSEMRKELSEDEVELRELTDSTLNKLSAMSDEDYEKLELYPDFDDEEDVDAE